MYGRASLGLTRMIEAIASFDRVPPKNCELIVVNDGSTQVWTLENPQDPDRRRILLT
jgi:hypothetical protein